MINAAGSDLTLDVVEALVRQSEIDFRTLREHIRQMLGEQSQVSVADLLERFPAEQGFGSVIGYVALGARHGEVTGQPQRVHWVGNDGVPRQARVPAIYFTRERALEFAD